MKTVYSIMLLIAFLIFPSCVLKQEHNAALQDQRMVKDELKQKTKSLKQIQSSLEDLQEQNDELTLRNQDLSSTNQILVEKNRNLSQESLQQRKNTLNSTRHLQKMESFVKSVNNHRQSVFSSSSPNLSYEVSAEKAFITIPNTLLFKSSTRLSEQGRSFLKLTYNSFLKLRNNYTIEIIGHTDNSELTGQMKKRFGSNWELAAFRAGLLVRDFIKFGVPQNHIKLASFGPSRPLTTNSNKESLAQNRRIVISVKPL